MKIKYRPNPENAEVMSWVPATGQTYWKPWWRAHLHGIRLIFQGHELEYDE